MTYDPQKQPYSSFENNTGQTDGRTDGNDYLKRCVVASKKSSNAIMISDMISDDAEVAFYVPQFCHYQPIISIRLLSHPIQSSNHSNVEYFDFDIHRTMVEELDEILVLALAKEQEERRLLEEKVIKEFRESRPEISVDIEASLQRKRQRE